MTIANESTVIAEAIQAILIGMSEFQTDSVVINDWTILDLSEENAPWAIVLTPGLASGLDSTFGCDTNEWTCLVSLQAPFIDWKESMDQLATTRDAVLSKFTDTRNLNTVAGTFSVTSIADATPSSPFDTVLYTDNPDALADNLTLNIIFTVRSQE